MMSYYAWVNDSITLRSIANLDLKLSKFLSPTKMNMAVISRSSDCIFGPKVNINLGSIGLSTQNFFWRQEEVGILTEISQIPLIIFWKNQSWKLFRSVLIEI